MDDHQHCQAETPSHACVIEGDHAQHRDGAFAWTDPKPAYIQRHRCENCGVTETTGNPVRTTVIDWRTERICDNCVAAHDWSDWYQAPNRTYIHN